jgi:hypothetical protein
MLNKSPVRKATLITLVIALLTFQPLATHALTSSEAKQAWHEAKQASRDAQEAHRQANISWAADKTEANNQKVIDTGKDALMAALDEAEAWLIWRQLEVEENPDIPQELKQRIQDDVETNLAKIDDLRTEVNEVENRLQLAIAFLKMVGKYLELVADVARNTGLIWVHVANTYADTLEEYAEQLREAAQALEGTQEVLDKLDEVAEDLQAARTSIASAEQEYLEVVVPGSPILSFMNGNQHLRTAKNHMLSAHSSLRQAYRLLAGAS